MVKKKGLLGLVILCFLPSNEDERLITVITASQCAQVSQCEHFLVVWKKLGHIFQCQVVILPHLLSWKQTQSSRCWIISHSVHWRALCGNKCSIDPTQTLWSNVRKCVFQWLFFLLFLFFFFFFFPHFGSSNKVCSISCWVIIYTC